MAVPLSLQAVLQFVLEILGKLSPSENQIAFGEYRVVLRNFMGFSVTEKMQNNSLGFVCYALEKQLFCFSSSE